MEGWPSSVRADECSSADPQNPCLTCGACCAAFRVSFYWSESDETVTDSVPADMTYHMSPWLCAMKGTDQPHPWCIALQGNVGVSAKCAIYERRPSVCREVTPSGKTGAANARCDRARAHWGLPPLLSVQEKHG
jgi:Fe-S-cluster containining protein